MKRPTCIFTADIHLREDQPTCRLDNFWETQARKIKWLRDLQETYGCPIIDAGDLFHKWRSSNFLARWSILNLPRQMTTLWGNHDTPYHNLEMYHKSSLGVLSASGVVNVVRDNTLTLVEELDDVGLVFFPWGIEPSPISPLYSRSIAVMHVMTYKGKSPWPGCEATNAKQLLKKMEGFDVVLTGHNHKSFVVEHEGRLLVNPGSLTRQSADQADHQPRVYLWDAKTNEVEAVYVPIEEDVISREHIDVVNEKNERLSAYIDRMNTNYEIELSYEKNMEKHLAANRVRKGTKEVIQEAMDV